MAGPATLDAALYVRSVVGMGRRSSDRPPPIDRPPLGVSPLVEVIDALAKSRGMTSHRVAYKRNAKGEHVIALIFTSFQG
jgi:hypothetical protein